MRGMPWAVAVLSVVFVVMFVGAGGAQEIADQVAAHLAAGEFGPAREVAAGAAAGERDRLLADIARQQAATGARDAAAVTGAAIGDDSLRNDAFLGVRQTPLAARGGGAQADFDTLIELIQATIAPTTWDAAGGPGAVDAFPGGVLVDPSGLMRKMKVADGGLEAIRERSERGVATRVQNESKLRMVSLPRLERAIQQRWARGLEPTDAMQRLAGLRRVEYILLYPETGDLVLAGPAGDWTRDAEGRSVSRTTGEPVLQLDDLVVLLRNNALREERFGCSITPRKENLARTQQFLANSKPLKPGQRARWIQGLRDALGRQDITFYGIDPSTRVAQVMIEADYRMKLVGMGLEEGVLGVPSYLSQIEVGRDGKLPPMNVLRWWFTLNYDAVTATKARTAFALKGQAVRVLSENELLTETGERVHTGKADVLTQKFAADFTKHFPELAKKHAVYAELRNVFDLAMAAALIRREGLADRADWEMKFLGDPERFSVQRHTPPTEVESVVNHRLIRGKHVVAGVSGGCRVEPAQVLAELPMKADSGALTSASFASSPSRSNTAPEQWWWD